MPEQNYKNHAKFVPMFHVGVLIPLLANFIWSVYQLFQGVTGSTIMGAVISVVLILMALSLRVQALTVQDRVIRLESRLRFREVLPADLAARGAALPVKQLVAMRFASDEELPSLVREVADGKLTTQKEIKLSVKKWQADHLRA